MRRSVIQNPVVSDRQRAGGRTAGTDVEVEVVRATAEAIDLLEGRTKPDPGVAF